MTTLVAVVYTSGRRERCDARCHEATGTECVCCCGGRYHGKQEGTVSLWNAVREMQDKLLIDLGDAEARGELFITACRKDIGSSPYRRRRDRRGNYQIPLIPAVP